LPISNFFLTLASSGDGKSAADRFALEPIRQRQRDLTDERKGKLRNWDNEHAVWEKARLRILAKEKGRQAEECLHRLGDAPKKPLLPNLVCEEPTFEGLCRLLCDGQPSQGIFTDEGGQFVGGHGMADDARLRTIANLSAFWDGKDISRVRASGDAYPVRDKRLTMHLMLQPIVAQQVLSHPLLRGQGFLARCLIAAPPSMAGKRYFKEVEGNHQNAMQNYTQHVLGLLQIPQTVREGTQNELKPRLLRLTPSQRKTWIAFQHEIEDNRGGDKLWEAIPELSAKLAEHALRLAGMLTLFYTPHAVAINDDALQAGIALARFYAAEALRLEGIGLTNPDIALAEKLLKWLHDNRMESVSIRDICRLGPNRLRDKSKADKATTILVTHRYLEPLPEKGRFKVLSQKSQASQGGE
jgi:GNAT superfamily N-acetyltransferase